MPLVSVIMPSYNHEKYISEAIESVLNQTFPDFELIIIDDASRDKSRKIIRAYEREDSRIRVIFHSENKGIARTVNDGLEAAEGKFISFLSSDDLWFEHKLERQIEVLKKNEDLVVWSEALVIDAEGKPTGETFILRHKALKRKKSGYILEDLLEGNYICGQSVIFKKDNSKNLSFDERLKILNDYKFFADLAGIRDFYFIPEPLVKYRVHERNTITSSDIREIRWDSINVRKYFLEKYGNIISRRTKNKICLRISRLYLQMGDFKKSRHYVYQAIRYNPYSTQNLKVLFMSLINSNESLLNLWKKIRRKD